MRERWLLVLSAVALRVAIALFTRHVGFDMQVMFSMRRALVAHGFAAYPHVPQWVYPPGFMPWLLASAWVGDHLGVPRDFMLRVPSIAADAALIWTVLWTLGRTTVHPGIALAAGSLVAFGPMFVLVSAYTGQFDALAILPAVIAVVLWDRPQTPSRALVCGLLIGIGAAIKTVPFFMVLALWPAARSLRERVVVTCAAAAVPTLSLLPFWWAAPVSRQILQYSGIPGLGGWSVVLLPRMTRAWFHLEPFELTITTVVVHLSGVLLGLSALVVVTVLCVRRRTSAITAACAIWLTVFATTVGLFPQYTIWVFPFLLLARRVREAALLSALLVPIVWIIARDLPSADLWVYRILALLLQLSFFTMWWREMTRLIRVPPAPDVR